MISVSQKSKKTFRKREDKAILPLHQGTLNLTEIMSDKDASISDSITALADENADTTDSELRYAAYGARLRTALRASSRYIAYVCLTFTSHRIDP